MSEYLKCPACGSHEIAQVYGILQVYGVWQEGWACKQCMEQWFTMDGEPFVPSDAEYRLHERPDLRVVS